MLKKRLTAKISIYIRKSAFIIRPLPEKAKQFLYKKNVRFTCFFPGEAAACLMQQDNIYFLDFAG